jgi:hypothetical protein
MKLRSTENRSAVHVVACPPHVVIKYRRIVLSRRELRILLSPRIFTIESVKRAAVRAEFPIRPARRAGTKRTPTLSRMRTGGAYTFHVSHDRRFGAGDCRTINSERTEQTAQVAGAAGSLVGEPRQVERGKAEIACDRSEIGPRQAGKLSDVAAVCEPRSQAIDCAAEDSV